MTDDFEARWRLAADADPMHATYPEAVPGYRVQQPPPRRPTLAEGCGVAAPYIGDPWTAEPEDAAVAFGHNGAMTVVWRKPDVPPVDAPVVVVEPPFDSEAELVALLAMPAPVTPEEADAIKARFLAAQGRPFVAVLGPGLTVRRRWWDLRTWWRR